MRTCRRPLEVVLCLTLGTVVIAQQPAKSPAPAKPAAASPAAPTARPSTASPGYDLVGSIREIMQGIVEPAGDFIFNSVAVSITQEGTKEIAPQTTEQWVEVRNKALLLAEAGNLLKIPGRRVAPLKPVPGVQLEPEGPDDLKPEQVTELLQRTRPEFLALAQKLTDAALVALRAADARSVDGLFDAGEAIDQACENCHLKYWYPKGGTPVLERPRR